MSEEEKKPYRVLARKYRPQNFDELIGQDALVRTLKNAITSGRIAQAYILTGVRGVGKTTTARIIARALNYKGPDGNAEPTTGPTDDCELCQAIAEDRHPDVLEMDAASRTGVDNIREILDGVRYAPTQARYKVYIIDEVHMLSTAAFNALLKTLEEPPAHVIFIFATTEIRKVPITVLSRCQRFDLRRVDVPTLSEFYKNIAEKEGMQSEEDAISLIARAADGSVRDGLSLLDQAIAHSDGTITLQQVNDMLGLADRGLVLDLLEAALKGDTARALDLTTDLYKKGADPVVLIQDMLDFAHLLTRLRAVPDQKETYHTVGPDTLARAQELAKALSMPTLGRAWQIMLKGLQEVQTAPNPQSAAEMIVIRLAYAADMPDPRDLLKKLKDTDSTQNTAASAPADNGSGPGAGVTINQGGSPVGNGGGGGSAVTAQATQALPQDVPSQDTEVAIVTIADLHEALTRSGQLLLAHKVFQHVRVVKMKEGQLDYIQDDEAPGALPNELREALLKLTGQKWVVSVQSKGNTQPTLAEDAAKVEAARLEEAKTNPVVKTVIELFPGTEVSVTKKTD